MYDSFENLEKVKFVGKGAFGEVRKCINKMNMILRYIILLALFSTVYMQNEENVDEVTKVGTAAANWLKLETNPRAIGMGGAFTSVGSGILGIPYNPACNSKSFFGLKNGSKTTS